jgi:hypothetical protein
MQGSGAGNESGAERIAHLGGWEWNIQDNSEKWSVEKPSNVNLK